MVIYMAWPTIITSLVSQKAFVLKPGVADIKTKLVFQIGHITYFQYWLVGMPTYLCKGITPVTFNSIHNQSLDNSKRNSAIIISFRD